MESLQQTALTSLSSLRTKAELVTGYRSSSEREWVLQDLCDEWSLTLERLVLRRDQVLQSSRSALQWQLGQWFPEQVRCLSWKEWQIECGGNMERALDYAEKKRNSASKISSQTSPNSPPVMLHPCLPETPAILRANKRQRTPSKDKEPVIRRNTSLFLVDTRQTPRSSLLPSDQNELSLQLPLGDGRAVCLNVKAPMVSTRRKRKQIQETEPKDDSSLDTLEADQVVQALDQQARQLMREQVARMQAQLAQFAERLKQ